MPTPGASAQMLRLKELKFSGIGRFVEEQVIDLSSMGNLIQVDGQNNNTGGSSGSGKSTIFNALDYLFGISDIPNTILQSRLTKEKISVLGTFDWDGKTLKIDRSKGKLSIDMGEAVLVGNNEISEEKLDEIIRIPRNLFRSMLHKRQKEGGFFLKFTPREIHEFLTDCLGLSDIRNKIEILDKKSKELNEKRGLQSFSLENSKSSLSATRDAIASLGEAPIREVSDDSLTFFAIKRDTSLENLRILKEKHRSEVELLEKERPVLGYSVFDSSAIDLNRKQYEEVRVRINEILLEEKVRQKNVSSMVHEREMKKQQLSYKVSTASQAKSEAEKIAKEIKKIRDSLCPTCEQTWVTDQAKNKEAELLGRLSEYKNQIISGIKAEEESAKLGTELESLRGQMHPITNPILADLNEKLNLLAAAHLEEKKKCDLFAEEEKARNTIVMDSFSLKQSEIRNRHSMELDRVNEQASLDSRVYESALSKDSAYRDAERRYKSLSSSLKDKEEQYLSITKAFQDSLESIENEFLMVEESKRAAKSYTSCSFDDALESIGEMSTKIIRSIPNMQNATIQLEGLKETKEGKIKEEVNAVISVDGEIDIPIKSLSGGEKSSVDLAIDLSVIRLIEDRTNQGIDVLVLDEPFTGLDQQNIEMVLEILKNSGLDKRIVLVDHSSEVKEMVDNRIVVVRDGLTSNIAAS